MANSDTDLPSAAFERRAAQQLGDGDSEPVFILAALALIGPLNRHWPETTNISGGDATKLARDCTPGNPFHRQVLPCGNPEKRSKATRNKGSIAVRVPLVLLPAKMLLISRDWLPGRPAVVKRLARGPSPLLGHKQAPQARPCFNEVGQLYEASMMSSREVEMGKTI
ncbi:uncharacterized protein TrAFT101_011467 [Trichoderma asperellum]|uniref:uncharacterized protein n=1 Tax=Trichoderma asperellum TaxID=101201 RepID=UPI00332134F1|nr:hypothetical protein TrAFT101_011467 [Trichoderma asperellum]